MKPKNPSEYPVNNEPEAANSTTYWIIDLVPQGTHKTPERVTMSSMALTVTLYQLYVSIAVTRRGRRHLTSYLCSTTDTQCRVNDMGYGVTDRENEEGRSFVVA